MGCTPYFKLNIFKGGEEMYLKENTNYLY
ncbi:antibiotic biosynthesis monooxygenase, partial [Listeria monocytogenes]|nr:antibiotic biosynthesis monooxygenase [Listeria monocytogenes]